MKFLISLVWPLRVWQLLGVAPFAVTKKLSLPTKNTKFLYCAIILLFAHIILLILSIIFTSTYINWSTESVDFSKYDNLTAMILIRITSCIIVGEAIFKLKKQIQFFKQIMRIDFLFHRKLHIRIDYKKFQFQNNLITVIWIFCLLFCVISVFVTLHMIGDSYDERFWAFYIFPLFVYSLNCQRMVLYVCVIRRRYQLLNQFIEKIYTIQEKSIDHQNLLETFEQLSKKLKGSPIGSLNLQLLSESQLKDIRNIYQMLYEATKIINDLFLWSFPLCICIDFHRLLVNVFLIFTVWLLRQQWLILNLAIPWGSLNIAHLIILSHVCHTTSKEVTSNSHLSNLIKNVEREIEPNKFPGFADTCSTAQN